MKPERPEDIQKQQRIVTYAWFASLVLILVYLLIPWMNEPRVPKDEPDPAFRIGLWSVAVIQAGVLLWWTRRALTKDAVLNAVRGTKRNPVAYYTVRNIVAIALAHLIAVYGFILAFAGGYFWDQWILTTLSAALLMGSYPWLSFFEELESNQNKQQAM
jgi:hypothetical protein